jgi:translation initiation factor IF-2
MLELQSNFDTLAKAVVIESHLSKQKGPIASVLVKTGTLSVGNLFAVGSTYGKVRAIRSDSGKSIQKLFPGDPGEIIGLEGVPEPGSILEVIKNTQDLSRLKKQASEPTSSNVQKQTVSLESLSSQIDDGNLRQLNLVIKADVHGSLEAIQGSINKIEFEDVPIRILHAATGVINESDIMLAKASSALILGFGVTVSSELQSLAQDSNVEIKVYNIIYEMLDDIERAIKGLYRQEFEDLEVGQIEVRQLFKFSKVGAIAGSYVKDGKVTRKSSIKVMRNGKELANTTIHSLKRFQEDVKQVESGFECGIVLEGFNDLQKDDLLLVFERVEKKRS